MRLNVYSQELVLDDSDRALEIVTQESDTGVVYSGVRMFLHSSDKLHDRPDDDDRSAITFWLPKSRDNRRALAALFSQMALMVDDVALGLGDGPVSALPEWFGDTACTYTQHDEDGATVIRYPGGDKPVKWRSDCDYCVNGGSKTDFYPAHTAMSGCRSGGRDHCTCDGCF